MLVPFCQEIILERQFKHCEHVDSEKLNYESLNEITRTTCVSASCMKLNMGLIGNSDCQYLKISIPVFVISIYTVTKHVLIKFCSFSLIFFAVTEFTRSCQETYIRNSTDKYIKCK